jgi:serine/threonine-protein kinase
MARVWAARQLGQRGFQKLVAIKTILPHLASDPEFERMFLDEARVASGVHHPNVCEIYELGEENRTLYLAMEWANGDSFSRILRPGGKTDVLDPRVAARIIADACAGAHAAHELTNNEGLPLGVVHRDLSPHNILVTLDGVVKVCDFGVAKVMGQLHEATSAGQLKGKLGYMAPEQVSGSPVDRRSDVFSLGCVLYEATTGSRPFKGDRDLETMAAMAKGEVALPTTLVGSYPPELERIVLRALAREPMHRFSTAELMRFALEEFLAKGQLVTQSHVAQMVRARIGDQLERRNEAINKASASAESASQAPPPPSSHASQRPVATAQMPAFSRPMAQDFEGSGTVLLSTTGMGIPIVPPSQRPIVRDSEPTLHQSREERSYSSASSEERASTIPRVAAASDLGGGTVALAQPPVVIAPRPSEWRRPEHAPVPIGALDLSARSDGAGSREGLGHYAMAALLGLFAATVIGGFGFFVWWSARDDPPTTAAAPPTSSSFAAATPTTTTMPAGADIVFRVTPPDATLLVDGLELGADKRTLARPRAGKTCTVVARAKGHDDAILMVDYFTTTPLDIALKRSSKPDAFEVPSVPSSRPARPRAPPSRDPGEIPNNPY